VAYYRRRPGGVRSAARVTSKDFIHWSKPIDMSYDGIGPTPQAQFYTNQTQPYFRAPHIYIATPARFIQRSALWGDDHKKVPRRPDWLRGSCGDTVFMSSRGGTRYDRSLTGVFVRPGIGARNWTSRTNFVALGILPTGPAEMSIYVQRHFSQPTRHIERMTLRTDGFVSVSADYGGGEFVTKPLAFSGKQLLINYSTSAAGVMRVEIQDASGTPIPGFALAECPAIVGDHIERVVTWKSSNDVSALAGKPIRLRFVMKDTDMYSIQFRP